MIVSSSYSPKFVKEIDSKSKKHGFEIEYLNDIKGTLSELRIIYRYNKRMFELLGIKDWLKSNLNHLFSFKQQFNILVRVLQ